MKLTILAYVLILLFTHTLHAQVDTLDTKIKEYLKGLKIKKETRFDGGDVWGTIYIYANNDSTRVKILVDFDAGDYGNGQIEYLVVDHKLIYNRDFVLELDNDQYVLRESVSHYNPDSTGIRRVRKVNTKALRASVKEVDELKNGPSEIQHLQESDYQKSLTELYEELQQTRK